MYYIMQYHFEVAFTTIFAIFSLFKIPIQLLVFIQPFPEPGALEILIITRELFAEKAKTAKNVMIVMYASLNEPRSLNLLIIISPSAAYLKITLVV